MDLFFSFILLGVITIGGLWGIYIRLKEFASFLRKNGWNGLWVKVKQGLKDFARVFSKVLGILAYAGLFIFGGVMVDEAFLGLYAWTFLLLSLVIFAYSRKAMKVKVYNPISLSRIIYRDTKDSVKRFIKDLREVSFGLIKILAGLLVILLITVLIVVFGVWFFSLSSTTIIIILLILILLRLFW
jgi:hypothetical protein